MASVFVQEGGRQTACLETSLRVQPGFNDKLSRVVVASEAELWAAMDSSTSRPALNLRRVASTLINTLRVLLHSSQSPYSLITVAVILQYACRWTISTNLS